jgi:hypothetical protein
MPVLSWICLFHCIIYMTSYCLPNPLASFLNNPGFLNNLEMKNQYLMSIFHLLDPGVGQSLLNTAWVGTADSDERPQQSAPFLRYSTILHFCNFVLPLWFLPKLTSIPGFQL